MFIAMSIVPVMLLLDKLNYPSLRKECSLTWVFYQYCSFSTSNKIFLNYCICRLIYIYNEVFIFLCFGGSLIDKETTNRMAAPQVLKNVWQLNNTWKASKRNSLFGSSFSICELVLCCIVARVIYIYFQRTSHGRMNSKFGFTLHFFGFESSYFYWFVNICFHCL